MSGKKSKHGKKTPLSDPDQDRRQQHKDEASCYVHGAIEAHPPKSLIEKHDTERAENAATHVTERKEDRRRETYKLLLEGLTVLAVIVYAGLTYWQICLTRQSLKATRELFQRDQRPYIFATKLEIIGLAQPENRFFGTYDFINKGKTPALHMKHAGCILTGNDSAQRAEEWFQRLGDGPLNKSYCGVGENVLYESVLMQGESDKASIVGSRAAANAGETWRAVIRIEYRDTTGERYWSDMCWFRIGEGGPFTRCFEHNDVH